MHSNDKTGKTLVLNINTSECCYMTDQFGDTVYTLQQFKHCTALENQADFTNKIRDYNLKIINARSQHETWEKSSENASAEATTNEGTVKSRSKVLHLRVTVLGEAYLISSQGSLVQQQNQNRDSKKVYNDYELTLISQQQH